MLRENSNYTVDSTRNRPQEVISVSVPLYKSIRGKYFVGQTETLKVGGETVAWAGLVNPRNSNTNLYVNVFTISNFSNNYLTAEVWLDTDFPKTSSVSDKVSPTNRALRILPVNNIDIRFIESTTIVPKSGINVYERIVPPYTTLVGEEDGKFIEAPGGNYVLVIKSLSASVSDVIVALGWWEKTR